MGRGAWGMGKEKIDFKNKKMKQVIPKWHSHRGNS